MLRTFVIAAAALMVATTPALAAPCRDAKGHFAKCPPKAATSTRCRDTKGKFMACAKK